jgi:hypothetical protein
MASNSSCIAARQLGSLSVARTDVGTGDIAGAGEDVPVSAYRGFGLNTLARALVIIG